MLNWQWFPSIPFFKKKPPALMNREATNEGNTTDRPLLPVSSEEQQAPAAGRSFLAKWKDSVNSFFARKRPLQQLNENPETSPDYSHVLKRARLEEDDSTRQEQSSTDQLSSNNHSQDSGTDSSDIADENTVGNDGKNVMGRADRKKATPKSRTVSKSEKNENGSEEEKRNLEENRKLSTRSSVMRKKKSEENEEEMRETDFNMTSTDTSTPRINIMDSIYIRQHNPRPRSSTINENETMMRDQRNDKKEEKQKNRDRKDMEVESKSNQRDRSADASMTGDEITPKSTANPMENQKTREKEKKEAKKMSMITPKTVIARTKDTIGAATGNSTLKKSVQKNGHAERADSDEPAVDPSDPFYAEKVNGLHYPGKKYCLRPQEEVEDAQGESRVDRVLKVKTISANQLNEMAEQLRKSSKEADKVDFVVGCTDPGQAWEDGGKTCQVLVCKMGLPRAEWITIDFSAKQTDPAIMKFIALQKGLDLVTPFLRADCDRRGVNFDALYAHRYLPPPGRNEKYGISNYLLLRTLLSARQEDLCENCTMYNQPPLYVADMTGQEYEFTEASIYAFKFVHYRTHSKRVERKLATRPIEACHSFTCSADCPCMNPSKEGECRCRGKATDKITFECATGCGCDPTKCTNRTLQRGRQHPLLLVRHDAKGWTSWTVEKLEKGEFAHNYVGELLSHHENNQWSQTYALSLSSSFFDPEAPSNSADTNIYRFGRNRDNDFAYCHRSLAVNSLREGNESRFNAHKCRPSCKIVNVVIDRRTQGLHHIAFFSDRVHLPGEELTINYHGEELEKKFGKKEGYNSGILRVCGCEKDCPIAKNTKEFVDTQPEDDRDSFLDSDEEKEREEEVAKRKDKKSRLDKRNERIAANSSSSSSATPPSSPR